MQLVVDEHELLEAIFNFQLAWSTIALTLPVKHFWGQTQFHYALRSYIKRKELAWSWC